MHHTKPVKKGDSHRMKWLYPGCQLGLLPVAANQSLITGHNVGAIAFCFNVKTSVSGLNKCKMKWTWESKRIVGMGWFT